MRRNNRIISTVLVSALALAACSNETPPQQPPPASVSVVKLETERVTLMRELSGRTNPFLVAEVRPQVSGIVEERLFHEGGRVEAGQTLYQLDDAMYEADYNSAKAAVERTKAALKIAQLNADRVGNLVKSGAVSKQEHDTVLSVLDQAKADVSVAQAALDRAEVQLDYASISSPIPGVVGRSSVTPGALVTANQPQPLATVQQLDPIYVDVNQSVTELLALRKALNTGQLSRDEKLPVTILLEDGSAYEHQGSLAFSEVTVDPSTGSNLLRVVVPNPEHMLLPGMYVRAVLGQGVREHAILVPQQGIARDPRGNTSAMVLSDDGTVQQRPVVVSRTVGDKWLVESGLAAGDRVIVEGLQKVQPGDALSANQISEIPTTRFDADRSELADARSPRTARH